MMVDPEFDGVDNYLDLPLDETCHGCGARIATEDDRVPDLDFYFCSIDCKAEVRGYD